MGKKYNKSIRIIAIVLCVLGLSAFIAKPVVSIITDESRRNTEGVAEDECKIKFDADSAYFFCQKQCDFGPRTMNSEAHDKCGEWIKQEFERFGCTVEIQAADLKGFDGTILKSQNIIARLNPEVERRILLCAHWDSRPWADNDPDEKNHKKPVMAANDGASGVAVMLEVARTLRSLDEAELQNIGIDFVCFDAEDWGIDGNEESWALGAQYWAKNVEKPEQYKYGILLDMVGGEGAKFYQEGMSLKYAPEIVQKVWNAAMEVGYSSYFVNEMGGYITDDHLPVNREARIPCIDIIAYYPQCQQSSFGPTWHTVDDTMDHISKSTLRAVGQTIVKVVIG